MITETILHKTIGNTSVTIEVVDFCEGCYWLHELYTATDEHQGGVTVQVPSHLQCRNSYNYYIGQTTPAELAKEYAKQGRDNPSLEAYQSLQSELAHYIQASDCALKCTVMKHNVIIAENYGTTFDYSVELPQSFDEYGELMFKEYGTELVKETFNEARSKLQLLAA